jgi:hypothetical protein
VIDRLAQLLMEIEEAHAARVLLEPTVAKQTDVSKKGGHE